jgi:hypothetical protein
MTRITWSRERQQSLLGQLSGFWKGDQHFLAEMRKSFRGNVYGEMGYRIFAGEIAAAAASPSMGNH